MESAGGPRLRHRCSVTADFEAMPDELTLRPIRSSAARRRLVDGPLFTRPYRGVRTFGAPSADARRRIEEAALLVPPGGALAGWAAALVHGFPWSDGEAADGAPLAVPIVVPRDQQIRVRDGLRVVRGLLRPGDTTIVDGLPVTGPTRTAFDEMRQARDPGWALARADAALRSGRVFGGQLVAIAQTRPGWRGVVQARAIAPLAVANAESPWESRLRWLWFDATGRVLLANEDVFDANDEWVARVDLLDPEAGVAGEFDGEVHGRPGQRGEDLGRDRRLELLGLVVVRATSPMVAGPGYPARSAIRAGYAAAARRTRHQTWTIHPR